MGIVFNVRLAAKDGRALAPAAAVTLVEGLTAPRGKAALLAGPYAVFVGPGVTEYQPFEIADAPENVATWRGADRAELVTQVRAAVSARAPKDVCVLFAALDHTCKDNRGLLEGDPGGECVCALFLLRKPAELTVEDAYGDPDDDPEPHPARSYLQIIGKNAPSDDLRKSPLATLLATHLGKVWQGTSLW